MRVTVRVGGSLAGTGTREKEVPLHPGDNIRALLDSLGLGSSPTPREHEDSLRTLPGSFLILVNGRNIEFLEGTGTVLVEGDVVAIFQASEGG